MAESKNQHSESDAFSQDDIDQLLQAAGGDDAESAEEIDNLLRNISNEETAADPNEEAADNPPEDLSADDIHSLLNHSLTEISLDDLEADLLQSQSPDMESPDSDHTDSAAGIPDEPSRDQTGTPLPEKPETAALEIQPETEPETVSPEAASPVTPSDDAGEVSQADIDKLLAGNPDDNTSEPRQEAEPETASPETPPDDAGEVSQEDIDKLLAGEASADALVPEATDPLPEESERSLYISQDELNHLLEEYQDDPSDMRDKTAESGTPSAQDQESILQNETAEISQNDIDMLLSPEADDASPTPLNPEEGLISQEDIDNLLTGSDEETEDASSSLISQEDIDMLLKGVDDDSADDTTDEVEETADSDLSDDDGSGLVSQDDIDALLQDEVDQDDAPVDTEPQIELDRVVLEEDDDTLPDSGEDTPETTAAGATKWYRSKWAIACSIGAFVILVSSVSLFLLSSGDKDGLITTESALTEAETAGESAPAVEVAPPDLSVDFTDFIVLAPIQRDDISYLKADVQVTCTSDAAVDKMASQKPFFRFIIYETFKQTLAALEAPADQKNGSGKNQRQDPSKSEPPHLPEIDQTKLKAEIRLSLEKALPEKGIQEVILKKINLS